MVAEPRDELHGSKKKLVGVVDVTVLREDSVLEHLLGANEYIYVSGIAVLNKFRYEFQLQHQTSSNISLH